MKVLPGRLGARRTWLSTVALLSAVMAAGCAEEVSGPAPAIVKPPTSSTSSKPMPVEPGIVCNAQHSTDVVVHGQRFSPIPIDIPKNPRVALPTLTLLGSHALDGKETPDAFDVLFSGDPDKATNLAHLSWQSQEQMTFTVDQEVEVDGKKGLIPAGLYDVQVQNPNDNQIQEIGALAVVDKPTFAKITPSILCVAQQDKKIDLEGTMFLQIEGANPELQVDGVSAPFSVTDLSDCTDIDQKEGLQAKYCPKGSLTLKQGSIEPGYPKVVIKNPETAGCHTEETVELRVVPPPVLTKVDPPIACVTEEPRDIVITGTDFLEIDGALPVVTLDGKGDAENIKVTGVDQCEDLPVAGPDSHTVRKCTEVHVTIAKGALDVGLPELIVTNPAQADCTVSSATLLRIVPPPTVTDIQPALVCLDDGDRIVEVNGTDFLTIADVGTPAVPVLPAVAFDATVIDPASVTVAASDCEDLVTDRKTVKKCTKLTVTIAKDLLPEGAPAVTVTNPDPAGCSDTKPGLLTIVKGPSVSKAEPPLICTEEVDRTVVLTGERFLKVGADVPKVTLGGTLVTTGALSNCSPLAVNGLTVASCTTMNVTVATGTYPVGHTEVAVENPQPAGCMGTSTTVLTIPPQMTFGTPTNLCVNSGVQNVVLSGTGFLKVGTTDPTVTVEGAALVSPTVDGCTDLGVDGLSVQGCTQIGFSYDTTGKTVGNVPVTVLNPDPSNCSLDSSAAMPALQIVPPPTITKVEPPRICSEVTQTLAITGTDFVNGATITITPTGTTSGSIQATTVTVNSATSLDATFEGGVPSGTYDVTVSNGAGACSSTLNAALKVDPPVLVFFVDPPVLYNGISVETTIFTSGLQANAQKVELVDGSGTATTITGFTSPQRPNKILAPIPSGLTAGNYTVRITSDIGCVGELPGGVKVTDQLTLTLDGSTPVAPSYVSSTEPTAVTLKGTGFTDTPRVYLNPTSGAGTTATALRAVVFQSGTQLTAVVPENTAAGDYDLIVVNPEGAVGLASGAVHVTVDEPPVITAVSPNSVASNGGALVTIQGDHFDPTGVTVSLLCKPIAGGATTTIAVGAATNVTATSAGFTMPAVASDSICLVTLTNADGASFSYSGISVKTSAANLAAWTNGTSMVEARRGLGLVAGRPTATSRYLYAIGGDDGSTGGAKTSVEATPTDTFGLLGTWSLLPRNYLPAKRTLAGSARIGRFVYLVGGHDGTGATSTTYRAQILDPLAAPSFTDLDASLGDGTTGLGDGLWYYRVAATFPSTDASNPSGESLGGEPFPVQLPVNAKKIILTLSWDPVPGANGYRIFRTPTAGAGANALELLDTVTTCGTSCTFLDDGSKSTTAGQNPLPNGSLGAWHTPAGTDLGTPREGLATVAAPNPTNANEWYLYAFGGRNGATYLNSYEWTKVTVAADGSQTVLPWAVGTGNIGTGKADTAAWVVTRSDSPTVPQGEVWVFVGSGRTGTNSTTGEILSGVLDGTTGDLNNGAALNAENGLSGQGVAAGGFGAASGALYIFGGDKLSGPDSSAGLSAGPTIGAWNAPGGGSIQTKRAFPRVAQESAFFYIAGGTTNGTNATNSVEQTVQ